MGKKAFLLIKLTCAHLGTPEQPRRPYLTKVVTLHKSSKNMLASERPRWPRSGLGGLGAASAASAASEVVPDEVGHVSQIIQKCDGREVEGLRVPRGAGVHLGGVVLRVGVVVPAKVGQVQSPRIDPR